MNESFASESVREKYFRKQEIKQNLQIYVEKKSSLIISFLGPRKVPKINKHRAVGLGKKSPQNKRF